MTSTTRHQILSYLEGHGTASAAELAHALGVTIPDVRHHLAALLENHSIEKAEQRPAPGRGRPASLYRLRPQLLENNLDRLCLALLETLMDQLPKEGQVAAARRLADHLAPPRPPDRTRLSQKLSDAIQVLNQMNYQARWEAHADAPHVYFNHCPYLAVLPGHPELCAMDGALLENLTGLPAFQSAKIGSSRSCLFYIGSVKG